MSTVSTVQLPDLPPPASTVGVIGWVRQNLLSSPLNVVLTLIGLYIAYVAIIPALQWVIFDADWIGKSQKDCNSGGACWVFIADRLNFFVYGFFPADEYWRINLVFMMLAALVVPQFFDAFPYKKWFGIITLTAFPIISGILLLGGILGIAEVATDCSDLAGVLRGQLEHALESLELRSLSVRHPPLQARGR